MNTRSDILAQLKELKPVLEKEYAVSKIGLFGSFADGSQHENSDIDLLVELKKPIGWKFFSLQVFLENVFNRKVDLVTYNALKSQLKQQILSQVQYV
jgi:uncharacterized protein